MDHHEISISVLRRFMGYGLGLGFLWGALYGILLVLRVAFGDGNLPTEVIFGMILMSFYYGTIGIILGAILGTILGMGHYLLTRATLSLYKRRVGMPYQLFSAIFSALVSVLICYPLLRSGLEGLDLSSLSISGNTGSALAFLVVIVLSCAWAGYRISAWVVRVQDQSFEIWEESY